MLNEAIVAAVPPAAAAAAAAAVVVDDVVIALLLLLLLYIVSLVTESVESDAFAAASAAAAARASAASLRAFRQAGNLQLAWQCDVLGIALDDVNQVPHDRGTVVMIIHRPANLCTRACMGALGR